MLFDAAISFAGEDRGLARTIAEGLKHRGVAVFYDDDEQANLIGENLTEYLTDIYKNKARYCIVLVSSSYVKKRWTRLEWRAAQARAFEAFDNVYILPVRLDETELPGLLSTVGYISTTVDQIDRCIEVLFQRVASTSRFNSELRAISAARERGDIAEGYEKVKRLELTFPEFKDRLDAVQMAAGLALDMAQPDVAFLYYSRACTIAPSRSDHFLLAGICAFRSGDFKTT